MGFSLNKHPRKVEMRLCQVVNIKSMRWTDAHDGCGPILPLASAAASPSWPSPHGRRITLTCTDEQRTIGTASCSTKASSPARSSGVRSASWGHLVGPFQRRCQNLEGSAPSAYHVRGGSRTPLPCVRACVCVWGG